MLIRKSGFNCIGWMAAAVLVAQTALAQNTLYVDDDAPAGGDGQSWASAYKYLQDALAAAAADPNVTEIRVAAGVYKPDQDEAGNVTPGNQTAAFQLQNGLRIRGGYAGGEAPDPDRRDLEAHESVLSGDLADNDQPAFGNYHENSFHLLTACDTDQTAELDGFTITAGYANGEYPGDRGGGMYVSSGSPTLTACTFRANLALAGGGMYNYQDSQPALIGCSFIGNAATSRGGAMVNSLRCSTVLTDCVFIGNSAAYRAGAMYNIRNSDVTLNRCTFTRNQAEQFGGAVENYHNADPTMTRCVFRGNAAKTGGAMYNWDQSNPTLTECLFSENQASFGGAMYVLDTQPVLANCTLSMNTAGVGGGICNGTINACPRLTNCILWGNSDDNGMAQSSQLAGGLSIVNYCCIQGWTGGLGGAGNFDDYPGFVAGYYLCQLPAGQPANSPCVDAGDPAWPLDEGNTRTDGKPDVAVMDMGYHHRGAVCLGDLNGNGVRNLTDFVLFAAAFGTNMLQIEFDPRADLTGDGVVNVSDFTILATNFGQPCP